MGVTVTECEEPPEVEGMRVSYQRVGTFSNAHHGASINPQEVSPTTSPSPRTPSSPASPSPRRRSRSLVKCCFTGPSAVITWFIVAQPVTFVLWTWGLHSILPDVQDLFDSQPYGLNILVFYVALSPLVVLIFPLGVISLAAGFFFGVWVGFPVALLTKTSGSVLSFLLARHTCGDYLRRTLVAHYSWLGALSLMMREKEFQTMALLRFSAIPAAIKNYGCGGLDVSLGVFALATALALSLESILLVPVGAKIDSLQDIILSRDSSVEEQVVLGLGIFLLLALMYAIRRTVRAQIEEIQRNGRVGDVEQSGVSATATFHDIDDTRRMEVVP